MPISTCDSCGATNVSVKTIQPPVGSTKLPADLCHLCSNTAARDIHFRPDQYTPMESRLHQTINFGLNAMIASSRSLGEHDAPLDAVIRDAKNRAEQLLATGVTKGAKIASQLLDDDER